MRAWLLKAGFLWRYLWTKLYYGRLVIMEGFVFIEPDVTFKVEPAAKIILKKGVYLKKGCILECAGSGVITLGERVSVGHYSWIGCRDRVTIEHDSFLGQYCLVLDARHVYTEEGVRGQPYEPGHVHIGAGTILFGMTATGPNVTVAPKSMVLSHSSVLRDLEEPECIWAGIPAVKKKSARGLYGKN